MKTTKPEVTDIHMSGDQTGAFSLGCIYNGARYHIWINRNTLRPTDGMLYKNPLRDTKTTDPEYFQPRILDQERGVGKIVVPAMLADVKRLREELHQRLLQARTEGAAAHLAAKRAAAVREAAPDLLDALKAMFAKYGSKNPAMDDEVTAQARAAIAKAEPAPAYDHHKIADELDETAQGTAYHGNALRVAKDFPCLSSENRAVLDRWATGSQTRADRFALQFIAITVRYYDGEV